MLFLSFQAEGHIDDVPLPPGVKELESLLIYFLGVQLVKSAAKSQIKKRGIK